MIFYLFGKKKDTDSSKTQKQITGVMGEEAVAKEFKKLGMVILERNFKAGKSEIDLIIKDQNETAFVEVKTRTVTEELLGVYGLPREAVSREQMRSIARAARCYIASHPSKCRYRFDIAEVYLSKENGKIKIKEIKHIKDAFHL